MRKKVSFVPFRRDMDYIGTWKLRNGTVLEVTSDNLKDWDQYGNHRVDNNLDLMERKREASR